jgi:dienelactone hydrolase
MWWQDLTRSIDYLESRTDIDTTKLCYYGLSFGAMISPGYLALDKRIKIAILFHGGLPPSGQIPVDLDPLNYIARIKIPVLMINGKFDHVFPYEVSQVPMYRLLGTPSGHKRHIVYDIGHNMFGHRKQIIRDCLDWCERYFGSSK